ncbi:hypothetical protein [Agromyces bauzanensis]|uniref:Uncharacterized protein n=1 Tax=Agromyces bauzanensis TaxID=1308924 RepID=A0A917UQM0_9MICO|nr:hypothetical protein [Agromyces bauzanensis]GGJ76424.1 hypothetical protein GCM10011372_13310 [Agromyces bauzanensis]
MSAYQRDDPSTRWISVVFLQGGEAEELLALIDREGPISAIYCLQAYDHGDATTEAALANGYVYDAVPAGSTDHTIEPFGSPYALTYSNTFGYVSLLRRYDGRLEPELVPAAPNAPTPFERSSRAVADRWQANPMSSAPSSHLNRAVAL